MKAFVTFIRTLFNSQATSGGGRALRRPFSLLVLRQGLARAIRFHQENGFDQEEGDQFFSLLQ